MSNYGYGLTIKAFCEIENLDFTQQLSERIRKEIEEKGKEYILGVDEEEFIKYLVDKYTLEPLELDYSSETIGEPIVTNEWVENRGFGERYQTHVYTFTVRYSFIGTPVLFRVRPSTWAMTTNDIIVNEENMTVSFSFKLYKKDPEVFIKAKNSLFGSAFANLNNSKSIAINWNRGLQGYVSSHFQSQKKKYQEENDFFAAINVKVNRDTASVFSAPTIKKRIVPQPSVSKTKEFSSEPMMANEMYEDLLKVVYQLGKSMEKKPSTYQDRDEEGLRDQFLLVLETRYESTTATGETFNRGGKTDIILKYSKDASNLFVAECKFWHGEVEFLKAISQLFDRYLTWRDSKASLLLFVTNKDFTNVLTTIKSEIKKHPYFVKSMGNRGESSQSYIFHLPQDDNKMVFFEVIAFHFDKWTQKEASSI
jgi:hypothetical protein